MSSLARPLRAARSSAHVLAQSIGLDAVVSRSAWRRRRLLVLCYHGISIKDEHEWADLYISQAQLDRRLTALRKAGATVLPLEAALDLLSRNALPPRAVSLTFDDGAYDFSARAMPVLQAHSASTMLYLTTWYCFHRLPVFNTVSSYVLWKGRGGTFTLPGGQSARVPTDSYAPEFSALHRRVIQLVTAAGMTADEQNVVVQQMSRQLGVDFDEICDRRMFHLMEPAELQALDRALVDIQLHTHRHRTPRDPLLFAKELVDNAAAIQTLLGPHRPLKHFCYPSGDYVAEFGDWLRMANIESATTCDPGLVSRDSSPFFLPRIIDSRSIPDSTFLAWVSGLAHFTHRRRPAAIDRFSAAR